MEFIADASGIGADPATPAVLFRRYSCDGTGKAYLFREERLFAGDLRQMVDRMLAIEDGKDVTYFIATDAMDLEQSDLSVIIERGWIIGAAAA